MADRKTVMSWLEGLADSDWQMYHSDSEVQNIAQEALNLLKEQEELLRKLQNDKDKLCLEVSEWKHKFHDTPPKLVSQGVVDQIRWERDTALSQLRQIGKGLGSKMDDIVALLKEQEAKTGTWQWKIHGRAESGGTLGEAICDHCGKSTYATAVKGDLNYCPNCGAKMTDRR